MKRTTRHFASRRLRIEILEARNLLCDACSLLTPMESKLYPPAGGWYDIPYRCLLSVGVPNLLASGRCISATHEGMAGSRVMGSCVAIGQAAGTAAAAAIAAKIEPAAVNIAELRAALQRDGHLV